MGDYDEPGSPSRALQRLAHGAEEMDEIRVGSASDHDIFPKEREEEVPLDLPPIHSNFSFTNEVLNACRPKSELIKRLEQVEKDAEECRSIKATLCVNCQPGRILHDKGCVYDEKKSVHSNLIGVLEKLLLGVCER